MRKKREKSEGVSFSPAKQPSPTVHSPVLPLPSTFLTVVTVTKRSIVVYVL